METTQKKVPHKGEGHRKRLREKFLNSGLSGFHDYEIIELLLSLNTPRKDCKESAKQLLKEFKSLQGVFEADSNELCRIKGVGPVNSFGIQLIKQIADRYLETKAISSDVLSNQEDLKRYLYQLMGHKKTECFMVIFLDAKNRVLAAETLFTGTLTQSAVYPREVIKKALAHHSAAVMFAHNHPSGDIEPSRSDIKITKDLLFALKYVGIVLHEHMIIGGSQFYSFATNGFISQFNQAFQQHHKQP